MFLVSTNVVLNLLMVLEILQFNVYKWYFSKILEYLFTQDYKWTRLLSSIINPKTWFRT